MRHFAKTSRLLLKKTQVENISVHILPICKFRSCDIWKMAYINNDIKNSTLSQWQATQFYFFHRRQIQTLLSIFFYFYMHISIGIASISRHFVISESAIVLKIMLTYVKNFQKVIVKPL